MYGVSKLEGHEVRVSKTPCPDCGGEFILTGDSEPTGHIFVDCDNLKCGFSDLA